MRRNGRINPQINAMVILLLYWHISEVRFLYSVDVNLTTESFGKGDNTYNMYIYGSEIIIDYTIYRRSHKATIELE